jgi:hypothetical protein
MPDGAAIKPTHKVILAYYAANQTCMDHEVRNEGALETAFQRLLADTGRLIIPVPGTAWPRRRGPTPSPVVRLDRGG